MGTAVESPTGRATPVSRSGAWRTGHRAGIISRIRGHLRVRHGSRLKRPDGRPPAAARASDGEPSTQVRLLGPLTIVRSGRVLALPASRKVRALFAYLALAPLAVTRTHLCELLWDVPNDPRGELRWCLSKVRSVVDEPGRRRVHTREDTVELDLADCFVDALEVARAAQAGIPTLPPEPAADAIHPLQRRLPGGAGRRWQPGLQWLADRSAASVPRPVTPPCWSTSSRPPRVTRPSRIWRRGSSWRPSTLTSTRSCSPRSRGAAVSGRARTTWRQRPGYSRPRVSIPADPRRLAVVPGVRRAAR